MTGLVEAFIHSETAASPTQRNRPRSGQANLINYRPAGQLITLVNDEDLSGRRVAPRKTLKRCLQQHRAPDRAHDHGDIGDLHGPQGYPASCL
jgi:hypothetical protein